MNVNNPAPNARIFTYYKFPIHLEPGEPERYRLVRDRALPSAVLPSFSVNFRFRTRFISGVATQANPDHDHVFRLRIAQSRLQRLLNRLVSFLPGPCSSFLRSLLPEWFLPQDVILKRRKVDAGPTVSSELFNSEVEAYRRLRPLQGSVVPVCYGQAKYEGTDVLILQDVIGTSLTKPEGLTMTLQELCHLLEQCLSALHPFGVGQEDAVLNNFLLVGDHLVALDFEMVGFDKSEDDKVFFMKTGINNIARGYVSLQALFREDGFLEAA